MSKPWNRDGKAFRNRDPAYYPAKDLVAVASTTPGRLRDIMHNDLACLIWARSMQDPKWPELRAALLLRGHTEADVDTVSLFAAKFATDYDAEQKRQQQRGTK